MKTDSLPSWRERQRLLYSKDHKGSPTELSALGKRALEAGFLQDAFEYFLGARDAEGLETIAGLAVETGDAFLLDAVEKRAEMPVLSETWEKLGRAALTGGKLGFAKQAFERAKNEAMLAEVLKLSAPAAASDDVVTA